LQLHAKTRPSATRSTTNRHCVQAATAALQDGRDEEYVVMALLHDIGFVACPTNHGAFAAALLAPYVSDATRWLLERHMDVQAAFCRTCPGIDLAAGERWRGHPHFAATLEFVARYDIGTIRPGLAEAELTIFEPLVRRSSRGRRGRRSLTGESARWPTQR